MADYNLKNSISSPQKTLIVIIFIMVFCVCLMMLLFSTPVYQVKASILVQKKDFGIKEIDQFLEFNNPEVSNIVQKLKSVFLLERTLQKLNYNLTPDTDEFEKIQKNLFVREIPPSNAIEITLTYHSVTEAARIVNTLAETLIQEDLAESREKIRQALDSVQTALAQIQVEHFQTKLPAAPINNKRIDNYVKEINDDLFKTEQNLVALQSNASQNQLGIINEVFSVQNLAEFKANITIAEKKLAFYLLAGSWTDPRVQNQLRMIWKEKTKIAATFKEQLSLRLDLPINTINDICAYEARKFDLQIRKQEFIILRPNIAIKESKLSATETDQSYQSLKDLMGALIEKQTILQSLNDLSLTKISWIDKAFSVKPLFRSSRLLTLGLSLGIALLAVFITGLLCVEFNSYKQKMMQP